MKIRLGAAADAQAIWEIEQASFSVPWSLESIQHELDNAVAAYYLLEDEAGKVLAFADLWLIADEGQLANIAVSPAARGQGLGEKLLRTAMETLFAKGCALVFLEVRVSNTPALGLYEKLGYERAGCRKNYYTEPEEDAYVLCCKRENYRKE